MNDNWLLYFHDPFNQDWSKESYKVLHKIDTIQNYWKITSLIEKKLEIGMFFLMREFVFPLWDDDNNKDGGALSMKILKSDSYKFWEDISIKLVSETLLRENNIELSDEITGISASPKKSFCIIKIWLKSEKLANPALFNLLPNINGKVIYNKHKS